MRDSFLRFLARAALSRPKVILATAIALAIASSIYAAFFLKMNANTDDLISPDRPYMEAYASFLDEFGDLEPIICVVAPDEGVSQERAETCIDELLATLGKIDGLKSVHGRIESNEQQRLAFLAMGDEELQGLSWASKGIGQLRSGVNAGDLVRGATRDLNRIPTTVIPSKRIERGASGILTLQSVAAIVPKTQSASDTEALIAPPTTKYFQSETGKLFFIEIMPAKDYGTLAVVQKPLKAIRDVLESQRERYPNIDMGLTGKPVLQADEMATTDSDMTKSSIIAIILVALLFMAVIGGIRRPLLAVVSLLIAIAWTFGLTTLVVGQLNLLSVVFTLILVGIGIDFGVHVVARFKEERADRPLPEALEVALVASGRGNITGAVTSSLAFFMALFTDFRGLQELGFIGGTGLILCLISMMLVLPALLVLFDREKKPESGISTVKLNVGKKNSRVVHGSLLLALAVVTALFSHRTKDLSFNGNVLELQATGLDSIKWEHRVLEDSSAATWFGAAVVDNLAEAENLVHRAQEEDEIGSVVSALDFVASPNKNRDRYHQVLRSKAQKLEVERGSPLTTNDLLNAAKAVRKLEVLARSVKSPEVDRLKDLSTALRRLAKNLEKESLLHKKTMNLIGRRLRQVGATFDTMMSGLELSLREALPASIRHRLVAPSGRLLVAMHPKEDVWDIRSMERYVAAMVKLDRNVTGVPMTHLMSIRDMKTGFSKAALYALIAVLVLVLLDFQNLRSALLAIAPLLVGALWLGIAMTLFDLEFNLANFFAVPILIGLGVDNGIHLVHRWREKENDVGRFGATQKGVLLTSLTSMVGFGCLAFATHRGLMSLGLVMALGCATSLVASLVVLPAILTFVRRT
ncbi:MAG: hopanoid biosynthesis associated RND transporter like protein HpnN [Planctomycetota bacterium]|jgi:hopanoid biosynthesis associated RND transporter like protein HpnN